MTPEQLRIIQSYRLAVLPVKEAAVLTKESTSVASRTIFGLPVPTLLAAVGLAAAIGLGNALHANGTRPRQILTSVTLPAPAPAPMAPAHLILNALLVPALDIDALPLRWVDPRGAALCGPNTMVQVNGEPLPVGALVPYAPFELEWHANGCRPFGKAGPRFDGRVTLIVYREDWGFRAKIEPSGLRITSASNVVEMLQPGTTSLQTQGDADNTVNQTTQCSGGATSCR
jgi:hypothetical protein